jgi:hypothetical protein
MTVDQVLIMLLGLVCGGLGWFGRELYSAVNKLKDDLSKLEVKIGTDYVRYDRLQDVMAPIMKKLDRIEEVLTHKVDK